MSEIVIEFFCSTEEIDKNLDWAKATIICHFDEFDDSTVILDFSYFETGLKNMRKPDLCIDNNLKWHFRKSQGLQLSQLIKVTNNCC